MNTGKNTIVNHAVFFTIILFLTSFFIVFIRNIAANTFAQDVVQNNIICGIINTAAVILVCFPVIFKLGLKEKIGFNSTKGIFKGLGMLSIFLIVAICYSVLMYMGYGNVLTRFQGIGMLLSLLFLMLTTGIMEEFGIRGILLQIYVEKWGKNRNGLIWTAVLSSLVFGFQHIFSLIISIVRTSEISPDIILQTIFQVIITAAMGFLYAVVMIRTKNIWIVAIVHGIYDFLLALYYVYLPPYSIGNVSLNNAFLRIFGENSIFSRGNGEILFFGIACVVITIWAIVLCRKIDVGEENKAD